MEAYKTQNNPNLILLVLITSTAIWFSFKLWPPVIGEEIQPLAVLSLCVAVLGSQKLIVTGLQMLLRIVDWLSTRTVTGRSGTAAWAKKKEFKKELRNIKETNLPVQRYYSNIPLRQ